MIMGRSLPCMQFSFVIIMLVRVQISVAMFLNKCPEKLMWNLRATNLCGDRDKYMCLYDTNKGKFRELCKDKPEFHRPGNIFVISGNLRYFAGRQCNFKRYQPHKWWTNGSNECQYLKSTCNEEGQVPYDNGTITSDSKCRCDYTNYYTFVSSTKNKCYCNPIEEECSCYRKRCNEDQVLTPEYDCVSIHEWSGKFVCKEYTPLRINDENKLQQRTTLCPFIKKDLSGTIQQASARIAHSVTFGIIVILGLLTIVFIANREALISAKEDIENIWKYEAQKDMQQMENKLNIEAQKDMQQMENKLNIEAAKIVKEIQDIRNIMPELKIKDKDNIPKNIRDKHEQEITEWTQEQSSFVETRAYHHLMSALFFNDCIVVTGSSGCGKSFNIHRAALHLRNKFGYEIVPVLTGPSDIINYNYKTKKQVFVVDDICGKEAINKQVIKIWRDFSEQLEKIFITEHTNVFKPGNIEILGKKLLISCRKHSYQESHFKLIELLTRKECNLTSPELCLMSEERSLMLTNYIPRDKLNNDILVTKTVDFFPLLCKLSIKKSKDEITEFFKAPLDIIRRNIEQVFSVSQTRFCVLVLCVLFDEGFDTDWFKLIAAPEKKKDKLKSKIEDIVRRFSVCLSNESHINTLISSFNHLVGIYLKRNGTQYRMIHDIIYETAGVVCGTKSTECFISNASSIFIRDNFIFKSLTNGQTDDTLNDRIVLYKDNEQCYFERLLSDLTHFVVASTFHNKMLKYPSFTEKLISFLDTGNDTKSLLKKLDTGGCKINRDVEHSYLSFKTTPLIESAAGGHSEIVSYLITTVGNKVNNTDGRSRSPLYMASEGGHTAVVELLLNSNADVSLCDYKDNYPLHMACEGGHAKIVNMLLKNNADIFQCNGIGESPLYIACKGGHTETVKVLLHEKDSVSRCNSKGISPLYVACKGGHIETVKELFKYNDRVFDIDPKKNCLLPIACGGGYGYLVELLLNHADVSVCDCKGDSPLHAACRGGHTKIVNLLLKTASISQFNTDGNSTLYVACEAGHTDTVKLLLDKNADVNQGNSNGDSPLYVSCREGHTHLVQLLLQKSARVFECNKDGNSPLYVACYGGHTKTVELLLNNQADISQCTNHGDFSLHAASRGGHSDIVQLLLQKGAEISRYNNEGNSSLYVACEGGHTITVKFLLDTGADVTACNNLGDSPLHGACRGGYKTIVDLLLRKNADISLCNANRDSPLHVACENGNVDTVTLLLDNKASTLQRNNDLDYPLHVACRKGHFHIARLLLFNNPDMSLLNMNGNSPLYVACKKGHADIVQLLLENNEDISLCNYERNSPLYVACKGGHIQIVKTLLQHNADVYMSNFEGDTPLHVACEKGYTDTVKLLLLYKADISYCNIFGDSPLHFACEKGYKDILKLLLQNNADIFACNNDGDSPLHVACEKGHPDAVKLLLQNNANTLLCNSYGNSPLHIACEKGHTNVVKLLLPNKENVLLRNSDGDTPLHVACEGGHTGTVKLLLQFKADISLLNSYGESPLDVARDGNHTDTVNLLMQNN